MNNAERREWLQRELADLVGAERPGGTHAPHGGTRLYVRAGEIIDWLQGAGLLWWGGLPVMQLPPEGADPLSAVRVAAEFWWRLPNNPECVPDGVPAPYWYGHHVLAVHGSPAGARGRVTVNAGALTPEQRAATLEVARAIVWALEGEEVENDDDSGGDGPHEES